MISIALGSNLTNDRYKTSTEILDVAIQYLEERGVRVIKRSSWYASEPVPPSDQGWFINGAIEVETKLSAHELLEVLHQIEEKLGRVRKIRWGARLVDLDLLIYEDEVLPSQRTWSLEAQEKGLTLPHPRLHLRQFVLEPLAEIAPEWLHPVLKKTVSVLLKELPLEGEIKKVV